jgi:hypothetical protein
MVTLHCTRKLRKKLGSRRFEEAGTPTTTLGDWYGNLIVVHRNPLILFASENSRLPVLLPAADFPNIEDQFRAAVVDLLQWLGVSQEAIRREQAAMMEIAYAPARNRSVLGTMTDLYLGLEWILYRDPGRTLTEYALNLSKTPCAPMDYDNPRDKTLFLMSEWRNWTFTPQSQ